MFFQNQYELTYFVQVLKGSWMIDEGDVAVFTIVSGSFRKLVISSTAWHIRGG